MFRSWWINSLRSLPLCYLPIYLLFSSIPVAADQKLPSPITRALKPCSSLLMGQFICINPNINTTTQQLDGCQPNNVAKVRCLVAPDIHCDGLGVNRTFWKEFPCKYTNGYSYDVSLILSILLGMFGADRFYLGYPGIGLLKLCTLGGFFLFQLVDIVLIVSGNLGPADGSNFIIPFYGQGSQRMAFTANRTYLKPPPPEL